MRVLARLLTAAAVLAALAGNAPAQDLPQAAPAAPVLTLDDAIRLALEGNKDIKVSSYNRGISRAKLLAARGAFDPALSLGRSTTQYFEGVSSVPLIFESYRIDEYSAGVQGLMPWGLNYSLSGSTQELRYPFQAPIFDSYGGVNITQPLLQGFGFDANLVNVRVAKANRGISDLNYRMQVINSVTNVVVAYSNLQLAHDNLGVAERSRQHAQQLLSDNEKQLKVGNISQSDVIVARSLVAELEEGVLVAERQVRDAENTLRELIGEDAFYEDKPLFTLAPVQIPEVAIDRKADLDRALLMRPDYQVARLNITEYRAYERAANNGLLPQVNFVGGYGYNGLSSTLSASRQQVLDQVNPSYSAGIAVTIPFTFSVARGTARAARLQREQSEATLRDLEATIALQVATAEGQVETTKKRVIADQKAYEYANEALDAEEKKKRAGASTTLAVEQVQQQLAVVEGNVAAALASERQALAVYDMRLGMTLERHGIKLTNE
jgi:outer membrane protein